MKLVGSVPFWLLRHFALLVPPADRHDWFAEWKAELTYVMRRNRGDGAALLFVCGSLQDAAWFRWDRVQTNTVKQLRSSSGIICLGGLLGLLTFTAVCSRLEPGFTHAPFAELYDVRIDASISNVILAMVMAFAVLPAITSLHPGYYPLNSSMRGRFVAVPFWVFLLSKALMMMMTCYFVGLSVAHLAESAAIVCNALEAYRAIRDGLTPLQFLATFASCLYGLRWVLEDQRGRCPVCLQCLTPLQPKGLHSRIFLSASRSEKFCSKGHGSLIVPEFQTSWVATQSWQLSDGR